MINIEYRINLMGRFPNFSIDISKMTCKNTHGDYSINQIICGYNKINAVIDWTTACTHRIVWEITRSFVYAEKTCANGEIQIDRLISYLKEYLKYARLFQVMIL